MIFVIMGHIIVPYGFEKWFHAFNMPVFFMLSGYCFNRNSVDTVLKLVKKRFVSLIIPYIIFAIPLFYFWNISLLVMGRVDETRPIQELLYALFWMHPSSIETFGVFQWFLTCLFFCEIIFFSLLKLSKDKLKIFAILLVIMSVIAYIVPLIFDFRFPLSSDSALVAVVFYGVGYLLKNYFPKVVEFIKAKPVISIALLLVAGVIFSLTIFANIYVNIRTVTYGNYFLFYLNAIAFSIIFMVLSVVLEYILVCKPLNKLLCTVGQHTLVILLLNSTYIRIYDVAVIDLLFKGSYNGDIFLLDILQTLIVLIMLTLTSMFINKYLPFLLGRRYPKKKEKQA